MNNTWIEIKSDTNTDMNTDNTKKQFFVSDKAKITLINALLKVNINNKIQDEKKHKRDVIVTHSIIEAQNENIKYLIQENKMLRESQERYKKMYCDLHRNIYECIQ